MKKILVLFLLIIATVLPTFATNWISVSSDKKTFIDLDSIAEANEYRNGYKCYLFWRKDLNTGSPREKEMERLCKQRIWYSMNMYKVCLDTKEISLIYSVNYNLKGQVIDHYNYRYFDTWKPIIPDTTGEFIYEIIKNIVSE